MTTTHAVLRTQLSRRLGIPPSGDGLIDQQALTECLNLANHDIAGEHHWPWLLTSAALTFTAGVAASPATMRLPRELVVNGMRAHRASSLAEMLDVAADGRRCLWFDEGATIVLSPTPGATTVTSATLYFNRVDTTLNLDSDTLLLPDQYVPTLIRRAAYLACERKREWESATQHQGDYLERVRKMRNDYPVRSGPRTVRAAGSTLWATWA